MINKWVEVPGKCFKYKLKEAFLMFPSNNIMVIFNIKKKFNSTPLKKFLKYLICKTNNKVLTAVFLVTLVSLAVVNIGVCSSILKLHDLESIIEVRCKEITSKLHSLASAVEKNILVANTTIYTKNWFWLQHSYICIWIYRCL